MKRIYSSCMTLEAKMFLPSLPSPNSDVVVQIVDARHPLLFRCPDLVSVTLHLQPVKMSTEWRAHCIWPHCPCCAVGVVCKGSVQGQGEHAAAEQGGPADPGAEAGLGQTLPERGPEGRVLVRPGWERQAGRRGEGVEEVTGLLLEWGH